MTAHDKFFQGKQAAAVLKHGILKRYPTVFTSKTGRKASEGRVVYLDGFAGPGRYEPEEGQSEGPEGSPLLAVRTANSVETFRRKLHCVFVERNARHYENLRQTLEREAANVEYEVLKGDVNQHLTHVLNAATNRPLLAFLDPFGTGLPYAEMTGQLLRRPSWPATEVLLNFNLQSVWRIGGLLADAEVSNPSVQLDALLGDDWLPAEEPVNKKTSENHPQRIEASLARIDSFLGDDWWREVFRDARIQAKNKGERAASARAAWQVARTYCERIKNDTGYQSFPVPIRRDPGHEPLFMMILFYRYPGSPFVFNDATSKANEEWRAFTNDRIRQGSALVGDGGDLFGEVLPTLIADERIRAENALNERWIQDIAGNMSALIADYGQISIQRQTKAIYGATLGLARTTHLRQAWDQLADQGLVRPRLKGGNNKIENQTIYAPQ